MSTSVVLIVGTRPEAIKLRSVAEALDQRGLTPTLLFTGQHPQLDPEDFELSRYPLVRLGCAGQLDPHVHVGEVTKALVPLLRAIGPDLVIVQGDTSSALGGALAAATSGTPLGHVEAGLRSHNWRHPWPEEEFRVAIDRESDLLFAPTCLSAANLRREKVAGNIHVTGNTGIDSLSSLTARWAKPTNGRRPRLLVTCHRRENWGESLRLLASALRAIAATRLAQVDIVLHPNEHLAAQLREILSGVDGISFCHPCGHKEMVEAMLGSDLVLSDSGGMQEEAAALGVPLLVLRETSERPEAIVCGNVELVGTEPERIVRAVRRRLKSPRALPSSLAFGDGHAGERIAAIIEEWLEAKEALSPRITPVPRTAVLSPF